MAMTMRKERARFNWSARLAGTTTRLGFVIVGLMLCGVVGGGGFAGRNRHPFGGGGGPRLSTSYPENTHVPRHPASHFAIGLAISAAPV
jgi:hypothetical protein